MNLTRQQRRWAYIFLLPSLVLFALTVVYPLLDTFWLSLHAWPIFGPKRYIAFGNYVRMWQDPVFWQALRVTLIWTVGVVPTIILISLPLALLLQWRMLRAASLFRLIYFIPVVTNMVAAAFVWKWLFEPAHGVINYFLGWLGLPQPGWLASTTWALPAMMIVGVWKQIGVTLVVFLAGLQAIPRSYYEAASIDGAHGWTLFRRITLPLLNPAIVFNAVMLVINAFRVFTIPYVMSAGGFTYGTPGGPLNSTRVFVIHIYEIGFSQHDLGYASANAFVLLLLILAASLIQIRLLQKPVEY